MVEEVLNLNSSKRITRMGRPAVGGRRPFGLVDIKVE